MLLCLVAATTPAVADERYGLEYVVTIGDGDRARVALRVDQQSRELRTLRFVSPSERFSHFDADGGLERDGDDWVWRVGPDGGEVRWRAELGNRRNDGSVDAMRGKDWLLLRTEDLVPPIASRTTVGAAARTTLRFELPTGWSVVTGYGETDGVFPIEVAGRRFDHPDGWIVAGDIGVRYDRIANTTVAGAAPREQSARRLDVMAFLSWHLAHVRDVLPGFPDRLLVAMAGDPFFRGGLSAPNSLFLHTDRPMISGNGTSTLLHELVHVGLNRPAAAGDDWIVEGLAEYYSSELLYRAGTVTRRRYRNTRKMLQEWGAKADALNSSSANGAVTARATTVFAALDAELARRTDGAYRLDDLVSELARNRGELTLSELRRLAERAAGAPVDALQADALPGYAR